jgi:predicted nucleotide-binding protein
MNLNERTTIKIIIYQQHVTTPLSILEIPKPQPFQKFEQPFFVATPDDKHHEQMT